MLLKQGVSTRRLKRPMRRALTPIDEVFIDETGRESVLTETDGPGHQPGSLHYDGLAVDYRLKHLTMNQRDDIRLAVKKALRERYGDRQYDVLFSANDTCLHVEHDPK